jgi:DNA-directed RNA polymerase subunit L
MAQPQVSMTTETIGWNFSDPIFADVKDKVISLLPSSPDEKLVSYITNSSTSVVNGLRRTLNSELEAKALFFDISTIETNEPFIKPDELLDRISYIPIDQDIDDNATFTLRVANQDPRVENHIVKSKDITQVGGKKPARPFRETFRLAELQPGRYLRIPEIRVVRGRGFEHSKFSVTSDIEYRITDFMQVTWVNARGNFIKYWVKVSELLDLMKKLKISLKDGASEKIWEKRVVVIASKSYQNALRKRDLEHLKVFDYVVENPEVIEIKAMDSDRQFLRTYSSTEASPKDFRLAFRTFGNIDPVELWKRGCRDIIARIDLVYNLLQNFIKEKDVSGILHVQEDAEKTQIQLKGEDYTIGYLVIQTAYELDSSAFVNLHTEHPLNRSIIINIKHPQALKLVGDALQLARSRFVTLEKAADDANKSSKPAKKK